MKNNRDLELLSAYADGELTGNELNEIEQKLKLSPELQQEFEKLNRLKRLTMSAAPKLADSPYFEARVMAGINSEKGKSKGSRTWIPVTVFGVLAVFLMIFLKYNPNAIEDIVKQPKLTLTEFYKQNLKPLLFAADLTNEDIFNFAFYHQLPLDKKENQMLQLGYTNGGDEYFEIKTAGGADNNNGYQKFIAALNLNDKEKEQMDSILKSYKEELEMQVLANEKNTIAINPNLWNYNKAIAADLLSFAKDANREELAKIVPVNLPVIDHASVRKIVSEVKSIEPSEFIFLTPDTIFSDRYVFDKKKFKDDMKKMQQELHQADSELKRNFAVSVNVHKNLSRLKKDSLWNKNFKVDFDSNAFRIQLSQMQIPEIVLPDMNEMAANIEEAIKHVQSFTVNFNMPGSSGHMNFRIGPDSLPGYNFNFRMPNFDSISHFVPNQIDSIIRQYNKHFNFNKGFGLNLDSLVSNFRYNGDSINVNDQDFKKQMKELEREMQQFRKEMENLRKDLRKDTVPQKRMGSVVI